MKKGLGAVAVGLVGLVGVPAIVVVVLVGGIVGSLGGLTSAAAEDCLSSTSGGGALLAAEVAHNAGFSGNDLVSIVAIAGAESGWDPLRVQGYDASHPQFDNSEGWGMWQIEGPLYGGDITGQSPSGGVHPQFFVGGSPDTPGMVGQQIQPSAPPVIAHYGSPELNAPTVNGWILDAQNNANVAYQLYTESGLEPWAADGSYNASGQFTFTKSPQELQQAQAAVNQLMNDLLQEAVSSSSQTPAYVSASPTVLASPTATPTPTGSSDCGGSPLASKVVQLAQSQLGVPYVFGAETPKSPGNPGAFDCSGLVQWVYSQVGVQLTHGSVSQFETGPQTQNPQPGDLVFFDVPGDGPPQPGHVGIYIGNGQMIDAPYPGVDVRVDSVDWGPAGSPGGWNAGYTDPLSLVAANTAGS